jgi:FdhD protein
LLITKRNHSKEQTIIKVNANTDVKTKDWLAIEEPLEIRLTFGPLAKRHTESLAITMRTPGDDFELVKGFLFSEGIISRISDIDHIQFQADLLAEAARENVVQVDLSPSLNLDWEQFGRHFYTSSSCGVCGKASIEMVSKTTCYYINPTSPKIRGEVLYPLPEKLRNKQSVFDQTGGLHAAALFDQDGELLMLREDVGRHNALDKLIGAAMEYFDFPLKDKVLLLSGRISFELVQKATMVGIPIIAAVGAPSSLAVDLADEHSISLIGFLKEDRFNIYCGAQRIDLEKLPNGK